MNITLYLISILIISIAIIFSIVICMTLLSFILDFTFKKNNNAQSQYKKVLLSQIIQK